ncbi:MAG: hypothetical protein ACR2JC_13485 [Chloroflexota bacterium]|nr:MAG: hypothetical protein DLM70_17380 [Chloroflexota bacterium]
MQIGTVVKSNSHISYLCRVYGKLETERVPEPADYAFGTFVTLSPWQDSSIRLVGLVRDTLLLNPDFGNLGPRLSHAADLAVLSPDYLNETGVLVDVLVVGWLAEDSVHHTVPSVAAQIGTYVETMEETAIVAFHRDARDRFFMGYFPQLMMHNDPMIASLLLAVLDRLSPHFEQQGRVLAVLKNNLAWKARVVPAG